jgi:putative flippase GtrA
MDRAIASALVLWHRFTITRYLAASIIALAFDVALFSSLVALALDPTIASAAGYCAGIVIHWLVSSRLVFEGRVSAAGATRTIQKSQFVASAFLGLGLTTAIVAGGSFFGIDPHLAKFFAVGISFVVIWYVRHRLIFQIN